MITRRTLLVSSIAGLFRPWQSPEVGQPDLLILHTNDLHGRVEVEGAKQGLAYVAREIRRQSSLARATLTLDAGDIIHGSPMEQRMGPAPVLQAMAAVGYDAATVGNHEFDFGPENLRTASRMVRFPFLSANVRDRDGSPWGPLRESLVLERGGRRIGIFGLTTVDTPSIQWPRTIEGIKFTDPMVAARKCVADLQSRVDLVVALSHLGYKEDQRLAHDVPGIHVIVGGHSHARLVHPTIENGVPIVQTGAHGRALGRLEVRFGNSQPRIDYRLIDVDPTETTDRAIDAVYHPHSAKLRQDLAEVIARLSEPISFSDLGKARTPVGTFLAECVRQAHGVQIGLFSSSQIGGQLEAGDVTRGDVYRIMTAYTRQHVVRCRLPADLVRTQLAKAGPSVQISGEGTSEVLTVAGPAHVIQEFFLGQAGVEIVYDDPLGPGVRDAVIEGLRKGLRPKVLSGS